MSAGFDPELLQTLLEEMPIEYRDRFVAVLQAESAGLSETRKSIDAYVSMVRKVSAFVTALDPEVADRLATTCHALLERFGTGPHEPVVIAAANYFVEEDEDDEITGVLGFDDDIQVVNAVCRVLGANDLLVPLIR